MERDFLFGQGLRCCPLCGRGEAETIADCWSKVYMTVVETRGPWGVGPLQTMYHIRCGSCDLELSRATAEAARETWNRRAGEPDA